MFQHCLGAAPFVCGGQGKVEFCAADKGGRGTDALSSPS